ncbi:hypothetical protein ACIXJS_14485 [Bacteroides fragilis]|nr:hypothetical protein [Bacteroides fragilis]
MSPQSPADLRSGRFGELLRQRGGVVQTYGFTVVPSCRRTAPPTCGYGSARLSLAASTNP